MVDLRLLSEADRLVTPAADGVSEPLCFRLPGRLRHALRRKSPALSNLVNEARELLSTTFMVQSEEHDQLGNGDGYTVRYLDAITLEHPGDLVQLAVRCEFVESHQPFDVPVAIDERAKLVDGDRLDHSRRRDFVPY